MWTEILNQNISQSAERVKYSLSFARRLRRPICGADGARGDQCDACGNELDPDELINPNAEAMMAAVASFKVLYNIDRDSREYLARYAGQAAVQPVAQQTVTLYDAVLQGLKAAAAQAARTALQAKSPEELVKDRKSVV